MTDQIPTARLRELLDAATGRPWTYQPWSTYPLPSGDYASSILLADGADDGEIIRELRDEDGELIAAAVNALGPLLEEVDRLRDEERALISENLSMGDWTAHHAQRAAKAEVDRNEASARVAELEEELVAARATVDRVRELHQPEDRGTGPQCKGCATHVTFTPYPCATIRAIDGEA